MNKLHEDLMRSGGMYAKWHNYAFHGVLHFAILLVFGVLMVSIINNSITANLSDSSTDLEATAGKAFTKGGKVGEVEDYILVKFKDSVGSTKASEVLARHGLKEKSEIKQIKVKLVSISPNDTPQEVVDRLYAKDKDNIEFAEVDAILEPSFIPNDPYWPNQIDKVFLNSPIAWDTTAGNPNIIIALGDTGTYCSHEDFTGRCLPGVNTYSGGTDITDTYGHGTAVAGVIAAAGNNGIGVTGHVWNTKILPIKISDNTTGYASYDSAASAITYAADQGAKIINISYGMSESSTVQSAANYMNNKKGLVTISSGNSGLLLTSPDAPSIITVAGTDDSGTFTYGNYGDIVDVVAPWCSYTTTNGGSYTSGFCGTSNASPEVAGVVALIYSANPTLTATQARNILFSTAVDLNVPGKDIYTGWGKPNAGAAVAMACTYAGASSACTGGPLDTEAPSIPTNLSATLVNNTSVNLTWSPSTDNVGVAEYQIFRNGTQIGSSPSISYTDSGLAGGTTYNYTVKATDAAGNVSGSSLVASVTTILSPPTLSITGYSVTAKGATTATITWTTNIPSTGSVSYGLASSNLNLLATDGVLSTSHSVNITALKPSTKYFYKVTATDQAGAGTAQSPVSNFRTARK